MKFNKNIALFIFILIPAIAQASDHEGHAPQAQEAFDKVAQQVHDSTQQIAKDSCNMFRDYQATFCGMKNPMIQTTRATLLMQKKQYPGLADAFAKKATSPYYSAGFISFIAGTSLLATSLVSSDKKTLLTGSALCYGASLGCYYTSRSDIINLRKKLIAEQDRKHAEDNQQ